VRVLQDEDLLAPCRQVPHADAVPLRRAELDGGSVSVLKCSCGVALVDGRLGVDVEVAISFAIPAAVEHWEKGHKVTASTEQVWQMVRQAAIVFARAQGVDVHAINVPVVPKEEARRSYGFPFPPMNADFDEILRMFEERRRRNRRRW
jgi:hypothetical protein